MMMSERGSAVTAAATITNKRGLHARASAKIVEAAARFKSQITVTKDGQSVDARSIMGLTLALLRRISEILCTRLKRLLLSDWRMIMVGWLLSILILRAR